MRKIGLLEHRICTKCGIDKPAGDFAIIPKKGILEAKCKKCKNAHNQQKRKERMETDALFKLERKRIARLVRKNMMSDPEKARARREKLKDQRKQRPTTPEAKERYAARRKERYHEVKANPILNEIFKVKARAAAKRRRRNDPAYRIGCYLRNYLNTHIKKQAGSKKGRIAQGIGCSVQELCKHIESQFLPGMSWGNWGNEPGCWSIDHQWPMSRWNLTAPAHQLMCNHFTNLRPMWHVDNLKKQNKISVLWT